MQAIGEGDQLGGLIRDEYRKGHDEKDRQQEQKSADGWSHGGPGLAVG